MKYPKKAILPVLILSMLCSVNLFGEAEEVHFNQAELDQMLAPIALYPDVLLSQVLMAATYPLEVVEASRWSRDNSELEGEAAVEAVSDMDWDDSIKALVGFPELIQLMDENLAWTRRLGDAFLLQQEMVMETAQNLRQKSLENGVLDSLENVVVEQQEEQIIIQPAQVEVVYVPYYSPYHVYGSWWWHDYPPYCWGPAPLYTTHVGFHWSRGFSVGLGFYYSTCNWYRHNVVIVNHHGHHYKSHRKAPSWKHNPHHRRGVYYRSDKLNKNYHKSRVSGVARSRPSSGEAGRSSRRVAGGSQNQQPDVARANRAGRSPSVARGDSNQRTRPQVSRTNRNGQPSKVNSGATAQRRNPEVARSSSNERKQPGGASSRSTNSGRSGSKQQAPKVVTSSSSSQKDYSSSSKPHYAGNSRNSGKSGLSRSNSSGRRAPSRPMDP